MVNFNNLATLQELQTSSNKHQNQQDTARPLRVVCTGHHSNNLWSKGLVSITNTVTNQLQSFIFRFLKLKQGHYVRMCGKDDPNKLVCLGLNPISSLHSQSSVFYQSVSMTSIHNNKDHRGQVIFSNSELEQEEESKRLKWDSRQICPVHKFEES